MTTPRRYKPSKRREATSEQRRQRIKQAAWSVFAQQGLDAATISGIVAASGASTGSFYNDYRTKQAVFDELLADLLAQVRAVTAQARARADDLETMLQLSYRDLLVLILGIEAALPFIARNQHHIRTRLYDLDGIDSLLGDIRRDVVRGMPGLALAPWQVSLVASLIVSNGIETLLLLEGRERIDIDEVAGLMTRLVTGGIGSLAAAQQI
ncbi:TetR/AcrR family transcriptional regulator [Pseudoxanthomonas winnipegensis]|uniref:TetR/AcrR family transcriptional regulator n=1 Tax=Pseudoxanthomonas winnipegensis TaxID=2480810 RepID=A0A4V2HDX0_9GAMM|nr:TetR family transcriptional regulator [Pseudoxanthomonas winnipegensis]RZZ87576.1 TetR/AcrR family transcriptional regulator [Pseudoxanthomonas winnipegensis]TAA29713.1 TetR/AcrR family transcriptional regulator [Pseudoxanthomonas winnipegensis]TAA40547.1 TetR/AcrR family transcriptional regulator [Pseudoxanthomonas winnipegensis]TBV77852.1 TetR/AcrR family transcriptional regulator [Pseudoxanthomonas winnipegensis]